VTRVHPVRPLNPTSLPPSSLSDRLATRAPRFINPSSLPPSASFPSLSLSLSLFLPLSLSLSPSLAVSVASFYSRGSHYRS